MTTRTLGIKGLLHNFYFTADFKHLGCFYDNWENRMLTVNGQPNVTHSGNIVRTNSPDDCGSRCKKYGVQYFGLERGQECFCGDKVNYRTSVHSNECNYTCPGDASAACGGISRINLYEINLQN